MVSRVMRPNNDAIVLFFKAHATTAIEEGLFLEYILGLSHAIGMGEVFNGAPYYPDRYDVDSDRLNELHKHLDALKSIILQAMKPKL
jgi:hypothetical protein